MILYRIIMKRKLISLFLTAVLPLSAMSEVTWTLFGGGMYLKQRGASGANSGSPTDKTPSWDIIGGLYLQVPVTSKVPIYIETGLNYRNMLMATVRDGYDLIKDSEGTYSENYSIFHGNFIELPLKAGYNLKLNDKNAFNFGLGPYASYCIEDVFGSPVTVGLTASVNYKFRSLNLGLSYYNATFYNGPNNYYKNSAVFTIGVTFGRKTWSAVGKGLSVAGSVAGVLAETYVNVADAYNSTVGGGSYDAEDPNYSSGDGSYSTGGGDTERMMYDKWESRAREIFDSMGSASMSPSTYTSRKKLFRQAQKEMRKWRKEAAKKGVTIPKSDMESATISPR